MIRKASFLLFLLFVYTTSSANAINRIDFDKRIDRLNKVQSKVLLDSIESIYYELYKLDIDYKVQTLTRLSDICKHKNHEAYLKCMSMLANNVPAERYQIIDDAKRYALEYKLDHYIFDYNLLKSDYYRGDRKLDSALILLIEAKEFAKDLPVHDNVRLQHQMGDVYFAAKLYDKALKHYLLVDSLKGDLAEWNFWRETTIRNNIGLIYLETGYYEKALKAYNLSEEQKSQAIMSHGDSVCVAYYAIVKSRIYLKSKNYIEAARSGKFAYDFFFGSNNYTFFLESCLVYLDALQAMDQLDELETLFTFFESYIENKKLRLEDEVVIAELRFKIATKLGDHDNLLNYFNLYNGLKDSLYAKLKTVEVVEILAENEYKSLEENYQFEKKKEFLLISFSCVLIAFVILVLLRSYQIRKLNILLAESNQTKEKLFSIISHDLRSPFNALLGLSEVLVDDVKNNRTEHVKMCSDGIYKKSKELYELMENLLSWCLTQKENINFKLEPIGLNKVIESAISINSLKAESKNIIINYEACDFAIIGEENSLTTVFGNVLSNAIKFSFKDSEINISTEITKKQVKVVLRDFGVGMTLMQINEILHETIHNTTRGTENEKGTGLGLQICKELIQKNKGDMQITSEINKGTKFIILLNKA